VQTIATVITHIDYSGLVPSSSDVRHACRPTSEDLFHPYAGYTPPQSTLCQPDYGPSYCRDTPQRVQYSWKHFSLGGPVRAEPTKMAPKRHPGDTAWPMIPRGDVVVPNESLRRYHGCHFRMTESFATTAVDSDIFTDFIETNPMYLRGLYGNTY
jgi:hypothetical protein